MRLICPNCGAQYEVDDAVIPENGRDVQCSNCGHTWFQAQADDAADADLDELEELGEAWDVPDALAGDLGAAPASPTEDTFDEIDEIEPDEEFDDSGDDWSMEDMANTTIEGDVEIKADDVMDEAVEAEDFEDEIDTPDTEEAPAPRRQVLDESLADVLREEAERERRAREAEAQGSVFEDQPDLGLDEATAAPGSRQPDGKERVARLRGFDDDAEIIEPKSGSRRDLLPDIEEINYTLRSTSDRKGAAQTIDSDEAPPRRSSFARGFGLMVMLAVLAVALYALAPAISAKLPQAAPILSKYVAFADSLRITLEVVTDALVKKLTALSG